MKRYTVLILFFLAGLWACTDKSINPDDHSAITDRIETYYVECLDSLCNKVQTVVADTFARKDYFVRMRVVLKEHLTTGDLLYLVKLRENGDTTARETMRIDADDDRHYFNSNTYFWSKTDTCMIASAFYIRNGVKTILPSKKVYFLK